MLRHRRMVAEDRTTIIAKDGPAFQFEKDYFLWECPGCGSVYFGRLGASIVSGWNDPVWIKTGTETAPTLRASLGCAKWKNGECDGHYMLDNGELRKV